jgi:hypothetical protein
VPNLQVGGQVVRFPDPASGQSGSVATMLAVTGIKPTNATSLSPGFVVAVRLVSDGAISPVQTAFRRLNVVSLQALPKPVSHVRIMLGALRELGSAWHWAEAPGPALELGILAIYR